MLNLFQKDFSGNVHFCGLSIDLLHNLFRNGSITGKLVEELVCLYLSDYKKAKLSQDFYDVDGPAGTKWEVRCLTEYGANLLPSNQIGKGRKYNEEAFFNKLNKITGYIIVDIRKFPVVAIYSFQSAEAYNRFGKKIKTKNFDNFLSKTLDK